MWWLPWSLMERGPLEGAQVYSLSATKSYPLAVESMARVAMTGTAAADPVADGAGAQAPATVVLPGCGDAQRTLE